MGKDIVHVTGTVLYTLKFKAVCCYNSITQVSSNHAQIVKHRPSRSAFRSFKANHWRLDKRRQIAKANETIRPSEMG